MTEYRTSNGVVITPGLRVFTYNCRWATVEPGNWSGGRHPTSGLVGYLAGRTDANNESFDGWFRTTDGLMNGERMSTTDLDGNVESASRFKSAEEQRNA